MYEIRELSTDQEFQDAKILWESSSKMMRQEHTNSFETTVLIVGAFKDNELIGTLRCVKWDTMPYYSIGGLYIKPNTVFRYDFSDEKNPITYLTDYILSKMESEDRYEWYYVRVLGKAYAKIQQGGNDLLNKTKLGHRYHRFVEKIFEPGEEPVYSTHKALMGNKSWNRHVLLVKCSLDNQYRKNGDIFSSEMSFLENAKKSSAAL